MNVINFEKGLIAGIIGVFGFVYNSLGVLFAVLTILMTIDFITGFIFAWFKKEFNIKKILEGILKKFSYFFLLITAILFDLVSLQAAKQLGTEIPINSLIGTSVTCWLISNEGISIAENLRNIGVPTPKFFIKIINNFRKWLENSSKK